MFLLFVYAQVNRVKKKVPLKKKAEDLGKFDLIFFKY